MARGGRPCCSTIAFTRGSCSSEDRPELLTKRPGHGGRETDRAANRQRLVPGHAGLAYDASSALDRRLAARAAADRTRTQRENPRFYSGRSPRSCSRSASDSSYWGRFPTITGRRPVLLWGTALFALAGIGVRARHRRARADRISAAPGRRRVRRHGMCARDRARSLERSSERDVPSSRTLGRQQPRAGHRAVARRRDPRVDGLAALVQLAGRRGRRAVRRGCRPAAGDVSARCTRCRRRVSPRVAAAAHGRPRARYRRVVLRLLRAHYRIAVRAHCADARHQHAVRDSLCNQRVVVHRRVVSYRTDGARRRS